MSFIPDQQLEEIRTRADIVEVIGEKVPLKKSGSNFKGLCPFHTEKSPSFMVHPEKQIFRCFGCGEGGDVFSFLMKYEGIDFVEALEQLAERYHVTLTRGDSKDDEKAASAKSEKELLYRINRFAVRFFNENLEGAGGQQGREYLEKRGIRPDMIRDFYLGYAPAESQLSGKLREKNVPMSLSQKLGLVRQSGGDFFRDRLMFTIVAADGKFLGFSGRALSDESQPKYLNSPESAIYHKSETLLGLHLARPAIREKDQVILVEGNFDLIRLHQEGLRQVVAPLGTALTEKQVRYLQRMTQNFVLIFDGDTAGIRAADRALEIFLPLGISPHVVLLPQGEDPDSFVRKKGIEHLREMISMAPSLLDVRIEHILAGEKTEGRGELGPQERVVAIKQIGELLSKLPGEIEKRVYIQRLADRFGLPEDTLLNQISAKRSLSRAVSQKTSNFSTTSGDHTSGSFPPIEKMILEILLSGNANPTILFAEIEIEAFSDVQLGKIWALAAESYKRDQKLDVARLLETVRATEEESLGRLLAELTFSGSRWEAEGNKAATDCLHQFRMTRLRGKLKGLSKEIRDAERNHDVEKISNLMDQKNRLLKEMTSLH